MMGKRFSTFAGRAGAFLACFAGLAHEAAQAAGDPPSELPGLFAKPEHAGARPRLPRVRVDTSYPAPQGRTYVVAAGDDLQHFFNVAQPGDVLVLEPGAVFTGPFWLPNKDGDDWIIVRSSAEAELPPPGMRVSPLHAPLMPKLQSPRVAVIEAAHGVHHFRFVGIEIAPSPGTFLTHLVSFGGSARTRKELPHHIVFDRCYLRGDPKLGTRRGIALNGRHMAVVDSHLSDFKMVGEDSQAVAAWNGSGPFALRNNTLEAAGENVLFGGGDPWIGGLVPSDIEVWGNHFVKPLAWKADEPGFEGTPWSVKNLFELKNARRVLVEGNVFEHNWVASQDGFAILFTVRNQDGAAPWSVVEDVTFRNNVVRHVAAGINILGRDDLQIARRLRSILVRNNLFEDIGGERWGGGGSAFLKILSGARAVAFDHNTVLQNGPILVAEGEAHHAFVFRNNILPHNDFGIVGTGTAPGLDTLHTYFRGAKVLRNVIAGGDPQRYPADNFFPASLEDVGFVSLVDGDYRLAPTSPYKGAATDGADVGVLFDELLAALSAAPLSATTN